jgi:hypothetical protein
VFGASLGQELRPDPLLGETLAGIEHRRRGGAKLFG